MNPDAVSPLSKAGPFGREWPAAFLVAKCDRFAIQELLDPPSRARRTPTHRLTRPAPKFGGTWILSAIQDEPIRPLEF